MFQVPVWFCRDCIASTFAWYKNEKSMIDGLRSFDVRPIKSTLLILIWLTPLGLHSILIIVYILEYLDYGLRILIVVRAS